MFSQINNPDNNKIFKTKSKKGNKILKNYKKFILNKNNFFLLDGPISYYFFKIKDKKILLFGDSHENKNRCFQIIKGKKKIPNYKKNELMKEKQYQSFVEYLKKMITKNSKKKQCLDFFLEDYYFVSKDKITQKGGSNRPELIAKLREVFEDCMKKNLKKKNCKKNFRFHYWDVRKFEIYYKNKYNKIKIDRKMHLLEEASDTLELYNDIDLEFKNLEEIMNTYFFIIGNNSNLKKYSNGEQKIINLQKFIFDTERFEGNEYEEQFLESKFGYTYYLDNELNEKKLKNERLKFRKKIYLNIEQIKIISKKIWKQMENLDSNYITKKDIIDYWNYRFKLYLLKGRNIVSNKDISKYDTCAHTAIWDLLMLSLTETYTIARMFRKFKNKRNIENCELDKSLKNIIYFAGDDHTRNIGNFIIWKFKIRPIFFKNSKNFFGNENKIDQCKIFPNLDLFDLN
tara:strand:+ start:567 stop:1937 length:1371 start_codon:yes stop_codon:yes gene_type:complete